MTSTGARALGVGALAPALGAAAHVEAGGGLPELTAPVLLVAFLTAGLAASVVRRRVGVLRLAVVLGAGQVAWHLAMASGGEQAGHAMTAADPMSATPSPGMVTAHLVTTVLVALGAAGADRAVAAMVAAQVGAVLALLRGDVAVPVVTPASCQVGRTVARPVAAALLRTRPLRGPPVRPAAA
ncbi:hypothetical protein [Actinomycetospora chiangmaiensis]|uniref:hypothetical protein n=1 Tax=Actinomycetospora chiangmaiensis TaxID=402650 RepID=UPI00037112E6|nr:hypothetical protein [Actinomycetospora chiangmaiensis]